MGPEVQGEGGYRKTSHAVACTTKVGAGGTRWKCLGSSERPGRRVYSVRVRLAIQAAERERGRGRGREREKERERERERERQRFCDRQCLQCHCMWLSGLHVVRRTPVCWHSHAVCHQVRASACVLHPAAPTCIVACCCSQYDATSSGQSWLF